MATVTAIYRPFLVAVRNTAIGTHRGVIRMFDKTPATEKFPSLHPHGALNQANMVCLTLMLLCCWWLIWPILNDSKKLENVGNPDKWVLIQK